MRALLAQRGFRLLLVGQTVSAFGDWMGTIGFMALSLSITNSPAAVGIVLVLRLLPAMLAGPLATELVARFDRRRTMLAMDVGRAAVAASVPLIDAIWWVYLCAFLLELGGVVFLPARDASIPELAGAGDLKTADGLVLASSYGTIPLGAAAFAAVAGPLGGHGGIERGGVGPVFWVDAVTFLVSAACIRQLRMLGRPRGARPGTSAQAAEEGAGAGQAPTPFGTRPAASAHEAEELARRGHFLDALRIPLVRVVAPLALAVALGLGSLFSLGIVFVRKVLGANDTSFSFLIALFGVGAALGLVALRIQHRPRGLALVRTCIVGQGVVIALMSLSPSLWPTYLGAMAFAFFTAASLTVAMEVLQRALEPACRVQAFAVFHVAIRGGLALAAVGAGLAAQLVGAVHWPLVGRLPPVRVVLVCSGLAVAAVGIFLRARFVAGWRVARASMEQLGTYPRAAARPVEGMLQTPTTPSGAICDHGASQDDAVKRPLAPGTRRSTAS